MAGAKSTTALPAQTVTATYTLNTSDASGRAFSDGQITLGAALIGNLGNGGEIEGAPHDTHGDPPEGQQWFGRWWRIDVELITPGTGASKPVLIWLEDFLDEEGEEEEFPDGYVHTHYAAFTFTITMTDVFMTSLVNEIDRVTREFMYFGDRELINKWGVDAASGWSAACDWTDGNVSDSGNFSDPLVEYTDFPSSMVVAIIPADADNASAQVTVSNWQYAGSGMTVSPAYYRPSLGDNPDETLNVGWGRTSSGSNYVQYSGGALSVVGSMPGWTEATGFHARPKLPVDVTFEPRTYKHADTAPQAYAMEMVGPLIQWTDTEPLGENTSSPLPWTGTKQVQEQEVNWEWPEEWQLLISNRTALINTNGPWCTTNAEASKWASLIAHPLDASIVADPTTTWPTFVDILHETDLEVINPSGVSRPADWTGSGGVTPNGGNNDLWHVAAESASPSVSIDLASRKLDRLGRLAEHTADTDHKNAHMIFINKANIDTLPYAPSTYLDDVADRFDENRTHWGQFTWLELKLDAPRTADITVTINYSTFTMTFGGGPYTCFTHTFGTSGEFNFTRSQHTVTYTFEVAATSNTWTTVAVDLMHPTTGPAEPDLYLVDSIQIDLPATGVGGAEDWELDDIRLTFDPNTDRQPSIQVRVYDPQDCVSETDPFVAGDYTGGMQAFVEGLHTLGFPEGFEGHRKCEGSTYQREPLRHCPDYVGEGAGELLDFARGLAYQETILEVQEGWTQTNSDVKNDPANKTGSTYMFGDFYMFDLLRNEEIDIAAPDTTYEWVGAPIVGYWDFIGGTPLKIYYEVGLQAKVRGMAVEEDRSDRYRESGTVELYGRPTTGGAWVLEDTDTPDENGRFTLGPVKTLDREYRIGGVGLLWTVSRGSLGVLDDERYGLIYLVGTPPRYVTDLRRDQFGRCWVGAVDDDGLPFVAWFPHSEDPLTEWVEVTDSGSYSHPSIVPMNDGRLLLAVHDNGSGHGALFRSKDSNVSWEAIAMAHLADDLDMPDLAGEPHSDNIYAVGIDAGSVWVEWSDDGGDSQRLFLDDVSYRKKICDVTGTALQASIVCMNDGSLRASTVDDNGTKFWKSVDRGNTWAQVT